MNGTKRLPPSRSARAERSSHQCSSVAVRGRSARFASDVATAVNAASAPSLATARANQRPVVASTGS